MSIAKEICRIAQARVGVDACCRVVAIGIEVGDESGIEPDNLFFWLEVLLSQAPFLGARPVIRRLDGDALQVSYLEVEDGGPDN